MTAFKIDTAHSKIGFSVRHMMFAKVRGAFTKWSADLTLDPDAVASSSVKVTIDSSSIDTGEAQRDGHLKSPDFLDVAKYPTITFVSSKVDNAGAGKFKVTGDLTIHGVTHAAILDVEELGRGKDPWGHERIAFSAKTTVDRKSFGLGWNQILEAGGVLIGENVEIEIDVQTVAG
jgi:polyisoprenoid-binding protein YceI